MTLGSEKEDFVLIADFPYFV